MRFSCRYGSLARAAIVLTACITIASCHSSNEGKNSQPLQENMHINFRGGVAAAESFAADLARQLHFELKRDIADHGGGKSGILRVYSIYDADVMIKIQSSIDDPCINKKELAMADKGYPVFSEKLYFISVFAQTSPVSSERIREISERVKRIAGTHNGKIRVRTH